MSAAACAPEALAAAGPARLWLVGERIEPQSMFVQLGTFTAEVESGCPQVLDGLAALYSATPRAAGRPAEQTVARFEVHQERADGRACGYRLSDANGIVGTFPSVPDVVVYLEYLINTAGLMAHADYLLLHAGAVALGNTGILIPGLSGAGKSTLVAALALGGYRYLSDDAAVIDLESGAMLPFLKAICLKEGGWQIIQETYDVQPSLLDAVRTDGEAVHYLAPPLPCAQNERVPVRYILLPVRQKGKPVSFELVSKTRMLMELAQHALNIPRHGQRGVEMLARLVEGTECFALTYNDLTEAVPAISALAGRHERLESPFIKRQDSAPRRFADTQSGRQVADSGTAPVNERCQGGIQE